MAAMPSGSPIFCIVGHRPPQHVGDADLVPQLDAALDVGRQDLLDDIAGGLADACRPSRTAAAWRGMGLAARHLGHDRDLDRPRRRRALHRHVVPAPVAPVAARHDFERQPRVAHRAGVRALHRHQHGADRPAAHWLPVAIEGRDAGEAGAQADHAVAIGGDAHRAADVVAVGDGSRCRSPSPHPRRRSSRPASPWGRAD